MSDFKERSQRLESFSKIVHKLPHELYCVPYDQWLKVGMCFHSEWADTDLEKPALFLWKIWSKKSQNYTENICETKWKTFDKEGNIGIKWALKAYYEETGIPIDPDTMQRSKGKKPEESPEESPEEEMPPLFNSDDLWEQGLRFEPPPGVSYIKRQRLLSQGLVYILNGHEGTRKSLFALHNAKQFLEKGKPVVWVDYENVAPLAFKRFIEHKWSKDLVTNLAYKNEDVWEKYKEKIVDECESLEPGLIIFDSMTSMQTYSDEGSNSNEAIKRFKGVVADWKNMGWTVLLIAHVAKAERKEKKATTFGSMAVGTQADVIITASIDEKSPDVSSFIRSKDNHATYKNVFELCMIESSWSLGYTILCEYDLKKLKNPDEGVFDVGLIQEFFSLQPKPYICEMQKKDDIHKEIMIMFPKKVTQARLREAWKSLEEENIIRKTTVNRKSIFGFDNKNFNLETFKEHFDKKEKEQEEKREEMKKVNNEN